MAVIDRYYHHPSYYAAKGYHMVFRLTGHIRVRNVVRGPGLRRRSGAGVAPVAGDALAWDARDRNEPLWLSEPDA